MFFTRSILFVLMMVIAIPTFSETKKWQLKILKNLYAQMIVTIQLQDLEDANNLEYTNNGGWICTQEGFNVICKSGDRGFSSENPLTISSTIKILYEGQEVATLDISAGEGQFDCKHTKLPGWRVKRCFYRSQIFDNKITITIHKTVSFR